MAKLVAEGPAKTPYTLIDSRPLVRFQEGAIPTAIHLPFIGFDKFVDRLPKDKNQLVVFYCGGITCTLSPNSLKKAKLLGYTNLRVYREGQPEWATRNYQVTTPAFVKAAYVDRDIPHVMIDARTADDATSGHIKGAVSVPAGQEKAVLQVAAAGQAEGAADRLRRSRRRPGRDRGARPWSRPASRTCWCSTAA